MEWEAFFQELRAQVVGEVRTDTFSRVLYSTDASIYRVMPQGVLIPQTVADVQTAVALARSAGMPILPRTAGTSLAGQAVNAALVLDFTRHLDQIVEINTEEGWVRVQPGVVLDDLNGVLRPYGWQFGPDPASGNRACLGGIVSNNSTGAHSILYGMTADHLLAAEAVLDDGSLVRLGAGVAGVGNGRLAQISQQIQQLVQDEANQAILREQTPRHWRRCGGYNLDRLLPERVVGDPNLALLLCGAEGTLGVLTEVTLRLVPRPARTALAVLGFANQRAALTAVPTLLECAPSAVELLDNRQLQLCRQSPEFARRLAAFIEGEPFCLLLVEFYGESEAELRGKLDGLAAHVRRQGVAATAVTPILNAEQQAHVWAVRKGGLGLLMSLRGDVKPIPFIEDSAVPVEYLPEYVDKLTAFCADLGTELSAYAHASAGCLHIRPLLNTKLAQDVAKMPQIAEFAVDLLRGYGGVWSSEHGDGRSRSWLNERFFGPELYGLYRQVKQIFDPDNRLNPGNIVGAGPMTEHLRMGAAYEVIPLQTRLDFRRDQGFARAVEMCNGAGACRQRGTGTMCPSFMATREEEHSTRGRANLLRAALSGALPAAELTSPRMAEAMALCVGCKACQSECPSAVDMAKMKTEFLAQYQAVHGTPLRRRLFAQVALVSRLSSGVAAPLVNGAMGNGLVRGGMERALGIAAQRELSPFARRPFTQWWRRVGQQQGVDGPPVVLMVDVLTQYNYPQIGVAAACLLTAMGRRVVVPPVHDCGRAAFSQGLVDLARRQVGRVVQVLRPYAAQGVPILFLEPSDLSMLLDDVTVLLPDDTAVPLVAAHCRSLEQFVVEQADAAAQLPWTTATRQVILHGHCHQKALTGTAATRQALALPPNYTVTELDTSCCGMAGSFGYEAAYQAVSVQMAERRLLPAVRDAAADVLVVAPGVSCRQQIWHGTGRVALHPAQVLWGGVRGKDEG